MGGDGYELVELGGDAKELDYTLKNFDQSARKIKRVQNKKPIIADIDFNEFLILEMDNEEELVLPVIYENNWFSEETDMDNETFVKSEELIKLFRKNYKEPSGELQLGGGSEHFRKQKVISVESPETHKIQVL